MLTAIVFAQLPAGAELKETIDVTGRQRFEEQLFGKRIVGLLLRQVDDLKQPHDKRTANGTHGFVGGGE